MNRLLILIFLLSTLTTLAQNRPAQDSTLFDFWIGEWEATWKNANGVMEYGKNSITKILDDKVILENFTDQKGYKGTSISVYNKQKKTWHQGYADNQGTYFNFLGETTGDKRIFRTPTKEVDGKQMTQRMVFYDITDKSMIWDWELSKDGGKTWELQWRINYKKKV